MGWTEADGDGIKSMGDRVTGFDPMWVSRIREPRRRVVVFATASAILLAAASSAAEAPGRGTGNPVAAPQGRIDIAVPEDGPREQRRAYNHEGFYLRANVGGGMVGGAFHGYDFFNGALSLDALVGGMPSPGTAVGGGVFTDTVLSTTVKRDGHDVGNKRLVSIGLIGPFVDGFPDANDGWHLGTAVGFSANGIEELSEGSLLGFGGVLWGGYDLWTAPEFSMGVLLRAMATRTYGEVKDSHENLNGATGSLVLTLSALFN